MKPVHTLGLVLLAALLGCADGGPVGSGISSLSAISGNVIADDMSGAGNGAAVGTPVRVTIDEVPNLSTSTDADGSFELSGDLPGTVTVRFTTAAVNFPVLVDVPDGSNVVMENVVISRQVVETVRVLGFFGQVAMVDCADGTLLVYDRRVSANQFLVRLSPDTVLARASGAAVQCQDINTGNLIAVQGTLRLSDRTIDAVTVTLGPPPPGTPPPVVDIRFHGRAAVINCPGGILLLTDPIVGRTRVKLTAQTVIANAAGERIQCEGIHAGDSVVGHGLITLRKPGVVEAIAMLVRPPRI